MSKTSIWIASILILLSGLSYGKEVKKGAQWKLKKMALEKKPKNLFLVKKTIEDFDVDEPSMDFSSRQAIMVNGDERFQSMD